MAIPPILASEIEYQPALSDTKMQLLRDFRPKPSDSKETKFVATYATVRPRKFNSPNFLKIQPFWQTSGYSGSSESAHILTEDASTPDGSYGILGFVDWMGDVPYPTNDSVRYKVR